MKTRILLNAFLAAASLCAETVSKAPEFAGDRWINSAKPISLAGRKGKVTVVHFWTFGCINCKHNLDAYNRWFHNFRERDVTVIGIHTPEFETERVTANVEKHVKQFGIEYPVLVDNEYRNWRLWDQQVWPAVYVVDKRGMVRFHWDGELNYRGAGGEQKIASIIEQLLTE